LEKRGGRKKEVRGQKGGFESGKNQKKARARSKRGNEHQGENGTSPNSAGREGVMKKKKGNKNHLDRGEKKEEKRPVSRAGERGNLAHQQTSVIA